MKTVPNNFSQIQALYPQPLEGNDHNIAAKRLGDFFGLLYEIHQEQQKGGTDE